MGRDPHPRGRAPNRAGIGFRSDVEEELRDGNEVLEVEGPAQDHLDRHRRHELDQRHQQEEAQEQQMASDDDASSLT